MPSSVEELIEQNRLRAERLRRAVLRYLGLLGELYVKELHAVVKENTDLDPSITQLQVMLRRMQDEGLLDSTLRPTRTMSRRYYRLRGPA